MDFGIKTSPLPRRISTHSSDLTRVVTETIELEQLLRRPSLRRTFITPKDKIPLELEPTSKDTTCGIWFIKGKWLQSFANPKSYVFLYGLVGCLNVAWFSYFYGCITTIEKRFKIPSKVMGLVSAGSDMVCCIAPPFLSYYTAKRHRPRWVAIGMYAIVISSLIMVLPHFLYGPGDVRYHTQEYGNRSRDSNQELIINNKMCDGNRTNECNLEASEGWTPVSIILGAQLMNGLGGSLYYTLGTSYMDDNIKKESSPLHFSFSYFIRAIGPPLGYWLCSVCLKIFVSPELTPTITEEDPRWIGAWWIGWLMLASVIFVNASLLGLFPRIMPRAAERKMVHQNISETETKTSVKDMIQTLKRILKNPVITCNNFAAVFYFFGAMAYWMFQPKYLELQYGQTASTSNMTTGTTSLIFSAAGILLSGICITRYKFRARTLAGWNVFVGLCSAFGMFSYVLLGCESSENAVQINLRSNVSCIANCNCDFIEYSPICGSDGINYISPCHAGCLTSEDDNGQKVYKNCSCIPDGIARDETCPIDCYQQFVAFVALVSFLNFMGASGRTSNFLLEIRAVDEKDKSIALGYGFALVSLLAFLPAPVTYGYILDKACLVWGKTCEGTGNCWLYDVAKVKYLINFTAGSFVLLGTCFDIGVWYYAKNVNIFDDDNEDKK